MADTSLKQWSMIDFNFYQRFSLYSIMSEIIGDYLFHITRRTCPTFVSHIFIYLGSSISLSERNSLHMTLQSLLYHIIQRLLLHTHTRIYVKAETASVYLTSIIMYMVERLKCKMLLFILRLLVVIWKIAMCAWRYLCQYWAEHTTSPGLQGSQSSVGYMRETGQLRISCPRGTWVA